MYETTGEKNYLLKRGVSMSSYLRVFSFMKQVLVEIKKNKVLLRPFILNVILGLVFSIALAVGLSFAVNSTAIFYAVLFGGLLVLYFNDYFNNGLTACMIYDVFTDGKADFGRAVSKTAKSIPGILIFAAISALIDLLINIIEGRDKKRSWIEDIILNIIYAVWTTATYFVMPSMVIENIGFFKAFSKSKEVVKKNPTEVGVSFVGMAVVVWVMNAVFTALAYGLFYIISPYSVIAGGIMFFFALNIFWGLSGFVKITYYTCFYMWAKKCAEQGSSEISFAPRPLAVVLAD